MKTLIFLFSFLAASLEAQTTFTLETNQTNGPASGIVFSTNLLNQTASLGTVTAYTPTASGLYRVSGAVVTSSAGTAGTISLNLAWTDEGGTATATPVNLMSLAALGRSTMTPQLISVTNGAAITYSTTMASVLGSPKYALRLVIERLQ